MKNQKSIAGVTTGSFVNYVMGNNSTEPKVGEGATVLSWTDRHAYEVLSVSEDKSRVEVQQYLAERIDNNHESEIQEYKFEKLNGCSETLVWRKNAWYWEHEEIQFTKDFWNNVVETCKTNSERREATKDLFDSETLRLILVPGKTKIKKRYTKASVIFGVREEYYDFSF